MSLTKTNVLKDLGGKLVVLGLFGFVNNPIFGIFHVDSLHNMIHLVTGGLALYVALSAPKHIALYGKVFGILYALITLLGFLLPGGEGVILGLVTVNMADNFLHMIITLFYLYIALDTK